MINAFTMLKIPSTFSINLFEKLNFYFSFHFICGNKNSEGKFTKEKKKLYYKMHSKALQRAHTDKDTQIVRARHIRRTTKSPHAECVKAR